MEQLTRCLIFSVVLCGATSGVEAGNRPVTLRVSIDLDPGGLSEEAQQIITRELEALWAPYGVRIDRPGSGDLPVANLAVRVILSDEERVWGQKPDRHALGAVFRVGTFWRRIIVVSPAAVMALVRKSIPDRRDPSIVAHLHARMLGRVIAHELGHILLDSAGHSHAGLMRATYGPGDVLHTGHSSFGLRTTEIDRIGRRTSEPRLVVAAR